MKKILKTTLGTFGLGLASYLVLDSQQKQNFFGAYLSFVSSCRAAWIVYESVQDYQKSLHHLPYNTQEYHDARHEVHLRVANRILELSKQNRGIYLKLGQYLGNLDRVVPRQFTQVLKVLQDSAPPVDYEVMKAIFESDLHRDSQEIFSEIDPRPVASASLAQVHKGRLASNNKQVAIKLQYPFLRVQSRWDLIMLKKVTQVCNYLVRKRKNNEFDFIKLYEEWTSTLVQELDFSIQVQHALKTKKLFQNNDRIYIPQYYTDLCSSRLIVMEYVQGIKVTQKEEMEKRGINPKLVGKNLIDIFTTMVFQHGFVHCDAHPGNFLIRPKNNSVGHDIVLLDHGLYRSMSPQTIHNFSGLFINLMLQNQQKVHFYAEKLNIHEHFEYLPLIFLYRSRNSKKKIGENITEEEKMEFREKDLSNFDSINQILQDLPPELMYIIRASNLITSHNLNLGGNNRDRLFFISKRSIGYFFTEIEFFIKGFQPFGGIIYLFLQEFGFLSPSPTFITYYLVLSKIDQVVFNLQKHHFLR